MLGEQGRHRVPEDGDTLMPGAKQSMKARAMTMDLITEPRACRFQAGRPSLISLPALSGV